MSANFLVEASDGTFICKTREQLLPEDRVVFDGPGAFSGVEAAQRRLDDDIASAGGLEEWKAQSPASAS
jgi:hypothetical protein